MKLFSSSFFLSQTKTNITVYIQLEMHTKEVLIGGINKTASMHN